MAEFTAKDVQEVRQATGAGMLDSKKALEETNGDKEAAKQLLREKGLAASAKRSDRDNTQGAVALTISSDGAAMVELKCETDFVAKSEQFNAVANDLANAVLSGGPDAASQRSGDLDELKITLKENIELGRVVQFVKGAGNILDSYLHIQSERGVNGVLVETSGTSQEVAHDIAVHIAFARPKYLTRDEVPADDVAKERARRSRRSPATRASPSRRSRRSSKVASTASSRRSSSSISRSRRTTRSLWPTSSARGRSFGSRRSRSAPESTAVSGDTVSGDMVKPRWKRVVLKLSGEAFSEQSGYGIDGNVVEQIASEIADVRNNLGVDIAVVVGGGNIWRGMRGAGSGMDRAQSDYMGMLATLINSLALQDALERLEQPTRVQTAIEMAKVAEPYIRRRAIRHLEKGRVVIFAGGTGNPYFTTDTTAALRAAEIEAEAILKGTHSGVDGVYTADPKLDSTATRFDHVTYIEVLNRGLKVMDSTAITFCMDNKLPIVVFDLMEPGNIRAVLEGNPIGTLVSS